MFVGAMYAGSKRKLLFNSPPPRRTPEIQAGDLIPELKFKDHSLPNGITLEVLKNKVTEAKGQLDIVWKHVENSPCTADSSDGAMDGPIFHKTCFSRFPGQSSVSFQQCSKAIHSLASPRASLHPSTVDMKIDLLLASEAVKTLVKKLGRNFMYISAQEVAGQTQEGGAAHVRHQKGDSLWPTTDVLMAIPHHESYVLLHYQGPPSNNVYVYDPCVNTPQLLENAVDKVHEHVQLLRGMLRTCRGVPGRSLCTFNPPRLACPSGVLSDDMKTALIKHEQSIAADREAYQLQLTEQFHAGLVACATAECIMCGRNTRELHNYNWLSYRKHLAWLAWYTHAATGSRVIPNPDASLYTDGS